MVRSGSFKSRLGRFSNVGIVVLATALALLYPGPKAIAKLAVPVLVTLLLYSSFREMSPTRDTLTGYLWIVGGTLCFSYLVLPVVGIFVASALLDEPSVIGFAIMLSVPTTAGTAIVWTRFSDGDENLAAMSSITSIVAAPLVTPVVLSRLLNLTPAVPAARIVATILVIVLLSVALLFIVPPRVVSDRTIDLGTRGVLAVLIYSGVTTSTSSAISLALLATLSLATIVIVGLGMCILTVGGIALGLGWSEIIAVLYVGTLKNLGIALVIAAQYSGASIGLAIVVFYVWQSLLGAIFSELFSSVRH